jgi:formyltetrahydrofolate deformylase
MADATPAHDSPVHWVLTLVCTDRPGIVHAVSGAIVDAGGNITESQQFASLDTGRFFMRLQVEAATDRARFESVLTPVADAYGLTWKLDVVGRPLRTLVLVSKAGHCLNDLLFRQRAGQLRIEVPLVLGNHPDLAELASFYDVPFESMPVASPGEKAAFEERILSAVEENHCDHLVLKRYYQNL